jgi:hypothetical protein
MLACKNSLLRQKADSLKQLAGDKELFNKPCGLALNKDWFYKYPLRSLLIFQMAFRKLRQQNKHCKNSQGLWSVPVPE